MFVITISYDGGSGHHLLTYITGHWVMALFFAGVLSSAVALPVSSLSNTSLAVGA
jgi:hypothetical protein